MAANAKPASANMPAEEMPPMPPADDPAMDRARPDSSAAPPADATAGGPPENAAAPASEGEPALGGEPHRRRRRRRRRPPREAGSTASALSAAGDPAAEAHQAPANAGVSDSGAGDDAVNAGSPAPGGNAVSDRPPRRRRRRRRPPPGGLGSAPLRGGLGSALPAVDASAAAVPDGNGSPREGAAERGTGDAEGDGDGMPRSPTLRLRRPVRGRRQLPRPPGLLRGTVENAMPGSAAPAGDATTGAVRAENEFPPRRRRQRPGRRTGEGAAPGAAFTGEASPPDADRPPRARDRSRRPGGEPRDGAPQRFGEPRGRAAAGAPRAPDAAAPRRRDSGGAARGRAPGAARDGQRGRGRDAPPRRVEQKLYALEAMVDRGFEDVPDEAEDSGSRRVHWTIVKRTVADQKSGKAMSATYVLQRDGGETEFPNLGAARAAANKTIVHPEKLTMSKAEHAAAKNAK